MSDHVHILQDFTSDRERLATVLDRLEPGGGTTLYDAAYVAIQRVAKGPAESKAVRMSSRAVSGGAMANRNALRSTPNTTARTRSRFSTGPGLAASRAASPTGRVLERG